MEQRANRRIAHGANLKHSRSLDKDAWLLLFISFLYTFAVALSNTYVNVYLWKLKESFLIIGLFNLYQYIAIMIGFIIAGRVSKILDRVFILRIGVIVLTIFYLTVLLLGDEAPKYHALLGIQLGLGEGFFWYSFNLLYFEITERENRDSFNGWNGLLTSTSGIIIPFLSGWFISSRTGVTGYSTIFFISLVVFVVAVIISFFFQRMVYTGVYRLKEVFKETSRKSDWRNIFLAMTAQGMREGVILFLIGLLIYIEKKNEFSLGTYTMIISAVTSITYFLVGRYIKRNWRDTSMLIGALFMALAVIPLSLEISYNRILIYGIGTSLFAPLYFIPLTSKTFDRIGKDNKSADLRGEYIVVREAGLNCGRIIVTLVFIVIVKFIGTEYLQYLLLFSGSIQIMAWYFMKQVKD